MWQPIDTAPKDGTWILLEGEMEGGDTSSVCVGRWEPRGFDGSTYDWRVTTKRWRGPDGGDVEPQEAWDWTCRVSQWMPLPA